MLFNLLTEGRDISVCHLSSIYLIVGTIITGKETDSKELKWFAQGHTAKGRYGTQTCPCCLQSWSCLPGLSAHDGISQVPGYGIWTAVLCWCCHLVTRRRTVATPPAPRHAPPPTPALSPSFPFLDPSPLPSLGETQTVCILPLAADHFCIPRICRSDL